LFVPVATLLTARLLSSPATAGTLGRCGRNDKWGPGDTRPPHGARAYLPPLDPAFALPPRSSSRSGRAFSGATGAGVSPRRL